MGSTPDPIVCIIGAGPYGVSIAAYLRFLGIHFRIFGSPMRRWQSQMPEDMLLKSESSCASSLYEPTGTHTLKRYCTDNKIAYSDFDSPVSRETFVKYALDFQRTLIPDVEETFVTSVSRLHNDNGFQLQLSDGATLRTENIIVATGLDGMEYMPEPIARLPIELRSHALQHYDYNEFSGKDVIVMGAGQSALEAVAILRDKGAAVRLMVRQPSVVWNPLQPKIHRSWYQRLRRPKTRLGNGSGHYVYDSLPGMFRLLPRHIRLQKTRTALGPAGARWLQARINGLVPFLLGHNVRSAEARGGRVALKVTDRNDDVRELITDHVLVATGYKFDIWKLPFLSQDLKSQIIHEEGSPRLSSSFESSARGLYFTGLASANSFGPVMRFLAGADFTARRISRGLARKQRLHPPLFAKSEKCPEW
jgi:thioredoxin reductase